MRAEEDTGLIPELSISFRFYYHDLMSRLCFRRSSFFNKNITWNKIRMSKEKKEGRGLKNTDFSQKPARSVPSPPLLCRQAAVRCFHVLQCANPVTIQGQAALGLLGCILLSGTGCLRSESWAVSVPAHRASRAAGRQGRLGSCC